MLILNIIFGIIGVLIIVALMFAGVFGILMAVKFFREEFFTPEGKLKL